MKALEKEGGLMPLVEIKVFEGELSQPQTKELIQKVTEIMVSFAGENLRQATWVVVQEVKSGNWGVGGKALGLEDIRAIQESKPAA
jgi:4-oxalocrotonate tautomerase